MSLPPQVITRIARAQFMVQNPGTPANIFPQAETAPLQLNFQPLLDAAEENFSGSPMVMIHFQARPKGLRRWGLYDSESDTYHSFDSDGDVDTESYDWTLLSIPDSENPDVIPTCVFVAYGVRFNPDDQTLESVD